jgi:glutathione synthase/RimK-type ligase-like ATP-grasp enzyme
MIYDMIAIHCRTNSFSERWIEYCKARGIGFIRVNIYSSEIIDTLLKHKVKILLAHLSQEDYKTNLISRSILLSIEKGGIKVFPDFNTYWHFDDKISEKYLFEVLGIPHAPTHVFYDKAEASEWLSKAGFPLVFKLRGGAGSQNVFLLNDIKEANHYLQLMFTRGMKPVRSAFHDLKNKIHQHKTKKDWSVAIRRLPDTIKNIINMNSEMPREKGYFLVQDYLSGNTFDTRITVIGSKAFAFRRYNRPNDFKASGSGNIDYTPHSFFKPLIALAFESAKKIGSQSIAFDMIFDKDKKPCILEMSYIFVSEPVHNTGGYWDSSLVFHNEPTWPEDTIIEHILEMQSL